MKAFLIALGVTAAVLAPSANATVGIFGGKETQTTRESYNGLHGFSRESRPAGTVYFLYELETKRSAEIRIQGKMYQVRGERTLVDQRFYRAQTNTSGTLTRVLSGAEQKALEFGSSVVINVSWQGSKPWSGDFSIDPKSGLPRNFPTTLSGRYSYAGNFINDDEIYDVLIRRATTVSLSAPVTKECNAANENFDQALVRLKNRLNASGYAEAELSDQLQ